MFFCDLYFLLYLFISFCQMGPQSELYIYQELPYIPLYYDFVSYAFIACPIHLFNEPNLDILRLVTDHRMVVTIFRDLVIILY